MLSRAQEQAILRSVRPKMVEVSKEIARDFMFNIPIDTGDLLESAYVDVDENGTIEFGYDEGPDTRSISGRHHPHGIHVEFGTSHTAAQPVIRQAAIQKRRKR